MARSTLLKISLRALLAWGVLSGAGFYWARPIVDALSPLMEGVVDRLQSDFSAQLSTSAEPGGAQLAMTCVANREIVRPGGRHVPFLDSWNCAKIDAVHALVPLIIYAVAVVAWPIAHRRECLRRVIATLALLPVVVLPAPLLLAALAEMPLHPGSFSAGSQLAALLQPFVFMELGGLWLLPLAAAGFTIRAAGGPPTSSSDPQEA